LGGKDEDIELSDHQADPIRSGRGPAGEGGDAIYAGYLGKKGAREEPLLLRRTE